MKKVTHLMWTNIEFFFIAEKVLQNKLASKYWRLCFALPRETIAINIQTLADITELHST